jgi:NAD(P)H-dependent flavin oxidoreductase YrpB (nitropropane dioxygenase family)
MGTIGVPPDRLREMIAQVRDLTSRPWALNVVTFESAPFGAEALEVALEARPPLLTLSFGDSAPAIRRARELGITVVAQVQDFASAQRMLAERPAALIVQGNEAGGHTGTRGTLSFAAQVIEVAGDTPVVVAGGIGDGRGLAAAIAMGAAGVVMGTRFKATEEFAGSPTQKQAIAASTGDNTTDGPVFDAAYPFEWPSGVVGRAMRNKFSEEWGGREGELRAKVASMPPFALVGELARSPETEINWAGESSGLVAEILPAAEVVRRTVAQAEELLSRLAGVLSK